MKWKRSSAGADFRPEAQTMLVWSYGVPFDQLEAFHLWLATHEISLAIACADLTTNGVNYLGTYLHMDTGAPRYQTLWGIKDEAAENVLKDKLKDDKNKRLRKRLAELRGYWSRDGSATDHRFGLARHFLDFKATLADSPFWEVTRDSASERPQPIKPRSKP